MKRRSLVASATAFFAGFLVAISIHTALATSNPGATPPDGNVSPNFYDVTATDNVTVGDNTAGYYVHADNDGYVYALSSGRYPYAVAGWTNNATAGATGVEGAVAKNGAWTIGYLAYMDSNEDTWGLYTPGNITGANLYTNGDNGYIYTNKISAPSGTLTLTASDKLTVSGDLTASSVGSFRYECASTTSDTSVTASCDGANDVMVSCSGTGSDFEGAGPSSATDCTAYTNTSGSTLHAYAYCFDPTSTTNTDSTDCGISTAFGGYSPTGGMAAADTTPPSAPTGLSASGSGTTVSLNWTDNASSDGVSYYNVYRSTTSGFSISSSTKIGTATASAYSDTGRSQGTPYYYKVTAVDGSDNESSASSQASVTIADTTAPSAPSNLSASVTAETTVSLNWNDNAASDGVSYYTVYRSETSGFTPSSGNDLGTATSSAYTDSTIDINTTYYYKVTAVDAAGNVSSSSGQVSAYSVVTSFFPGTKVLTPSGTKNIEDLKAGDQILSYDVDAQKIVVATVVNPNPHYNNYYYLINGSLKVTGFHPFAVKDANGTLSWKRAKELVVGDLLVKPDGSTTTVTSTARYDLPAPTLVYNPSMNEPHTYFVLLDDNTAVLVHNKVSW